MDNKPYVVSADIYLLLNNWAKQKNFTLPDQEFFFYLRKEFSNYMLQLFPDFEYISEEEICKHIQKITQESNLPCVSLDPVYFYCDLSIELTRKVNFQGIDKGLQHRFGSNSLLKQLSQLRLHQIKEICLVDDVIFSGVLMERVIKLLSDMGINVPVVCAGVGIQEGVNRILNSKREVSCAKIYHEVIDEICERDFYLGVPYGGRSMVGDGNICLPYFLPYGNPGEWASIPASLEIDFSKFCINQTISLFEEIEKASSKQICCSDIDRKIPMQPEHGSYINFLKSLKVS